MVVCSEFVMHDFKGFLLEAKTPFMKAGTDIYRLCTVHITIPDERKNYSELRKNYRKEDFLPKFSTFSQHK